ncbi:MAG TPA: DUF6491 family protein [Rhodanobacter sp.]
MRTTLLIVLLAMGVGTGAAHADDKMPARTPLAAGDCINITQINEWYVVDAKTAIVRTGPKRYLVKLQNSCPRLGTPPPGLMFRANPSNLAVNNGRICGEAGETVHSLNQPPCAIESVSLIGKTRFDKLAAHALHHGTAAERPTTAPTH